MGYNAAGKRFMKIKLLLFLLLTAFVAYGQDIIVKRNTDEIQAKIIEVTMSEIKYKNWNNLDGPTYVISKTEVFMVKYANGEKESFADHSNSTNNSQAAVQNDNVSFPSSTEYEYYPKAQSLLLINGEIATVEQSKQILGEDTYRRLSINKLWEGVGYFLEIIGGCTIGAGIGLIADMKIDGYNRYYPYRKEGLICIGSGFAIAGVGLIMAVAFPKKNKSIVESYNNLSVYNKQSTHHVFLTPASTGIGVTIHF